MEEIIRTSVAHPSDVDGMKASFSGATGYDQALSSGKVATSDPMDSYNARPRCVFVANSRNGASVDIRGASFGWSVVHDGRRGNSEATATKKAGLGNTVKQGNSEIGRGEITEFTISNITMYVAPGTLTAIIGPVGCGKSSLLNALLGELDITNGTCIVTGKVAYASQVRVGKYSKCDCYRQGLIFVCLARCRASRVQACVIIFFSDYGWTRVPTKRY